MTPARFCKIGELLYGPSWRGLLARKLDIGDRSIYRLIDGTQPIRNEIVGKMETLCRQQAQALLDTADELKLARKAETAR